MGVHTDPSRRSLIVGWYFIIILASILAGSQILAVTAVVTGPDVTGIRMSISQDLQSGKNVTITDYIRNTGSGDADMFTIRYYLIPAGSEDSSRPEDQVYVGSVDITGLRAGAQKKVNVTAIVPVATPTGDYYIIREIDPEHAILGETTGNNRERTDIALHVLPAEGGPDYIAGLFTEVAGSLYTGSQVDVITAVRNNGDESGVPITLSYYLTPSSGNGSDLIPLGSLNAPAPDPGSEKEIAGTFILPEDIIPGRWFIVTSFTPLTDIPSTGPGGLFWYNEEPLQIEADFVHESDREQQEPGSHEPDIISLGTIYPEKAYIGESFDIEDGVMNIGGITASIVRVEYLLSLNEEETVGRHLGWWTLMNLPPGETRSSRETLGIPSGIRPGGYYLVKKITVTSNPPEKNTGNNIWISNTPINVLYNPSARIADIVHISTQFPSGQPGETVQITDTITNSGNACAENIPVGYYISPYAQFDPSTATYLGVWTIDSLCPGEQKTQITQVIIPVNMKKGSYYWYSVIDPCSYLPDCSDYLPELDKSNNLQTGTLTIGPCVFCGS